MIVADSFSWAELNRLNERLKSLEDRNVNTIARAKERDEAYLREAEINSIGDIVRVSVNPGQQIYDVIDITDTRAGLSAAKRRVLGKTMFYDRKRADYYQEFVLEAI